MLTILSLYSSTGHATFDTSKLQPAVAAPTYDEGDIKQSVINNLGRIGNPELENHIAQQRIEEQKRIANNDVPNVNNDNRIITNNGPGPVTNTDAKKYPPKAVGAEHVPLFPNQAELIKTFHKFQAGIQDAKDQIQTGIQTAKDQAAKALIVHEPVVVPAQPDAAADTIVEQEKPVALSNHEFDAPSTCTPRNNILLLKTHKCSSSTLQNILYRWGDDHNLSFVLPKGGMPYLGSPALFSKEYAIDSADGVYNILANHARFSEKGRAFYNAFFKAIIYKVNKDSHFGRICFRVCILFQLPQTFST